MGYSIVSEMLDEAVGLEDFAVWSEWALARVGFRPSNALAVVDVCRDELMSSFDEAVANVWGRPFEIGALGGMVFLGQTGFRAALSHVPGEDGRQRFVVFCFPHLGIDENGEPGRVQRRGMYRESSACGALIAYREQLLQGENGFQIEADDVEQSLLRRRLEPMLPTERIPSLVELTQLARRSAVEDVRRFVGLARDDEPLDVAYISGVVLHLPGEVDMVTSVDAEVVVEDDIMPLPH